MTLFRLEWFQVVSMLLGLCECHNVVLLFHFYT